MNQIVMMQFFLINLESKFISENEHGEIEKSENNDYFADDNDEETLNFEPGVSTDIEFVTLVAVKIIYDLLNTVYI